MTFYKNAETGERRIVKELGHNFFVVVKLVKPGVYTLKIWHGDLQSTASRWNTKLYHPSQSERDELVRAYSSIVNKMRSPMSRL